MTRCEACHSIYHTHRAVQCCGCLQQHFPFCLSSSGAASICWICPLCAQNPPERLIVLQELARACNSSKNNSCAITNLEKPVFSRLMNHKQKGRVLGPDDSYKGPYCEGIPLPQLLYKMASAHNGAREQLVAEVPTAKASQAAVEASNKLYRFNNSSGNYATVMATERTEYGDPAGASQRGCQDSQVSNVTSLSVNVHHEEIRNCSSGRKRKTPPAEAATETGDSFSFPELSTQVDTPGLGPKSTWRCHRGREPQSASADATCQQLRRDTIGIPRELTEQETTAKQAEIMRMLSLSPKAKRLRSPYVGWLHSAVDCRQRRGRVHQLYTILCDLAGPDSNEDPQVTQRREDYMLRLLSAGY